MLTLMSGRQSTRNVNECFPKVRLSFDGGEGIIRSAAGYDESKCTNLGKYIYALFENAD